MFQEYKDRDGNTKLFDANRDGDSPVINYFDIPIIARYEVHELQQENLSRCMLSCRAVSIMVLAADVSIQNTSHSQHNNRVTLTPFRHSSNFNWSSSFQVYQSQSYSMEGQNFDAGRTRWLHIRGGVPEFRWPGILTSAGCIHWRR